MRPLGCSKASEPANEWPEKSTSDGLHRVSAAPASSSEAAGSHARCAVGIKRSRNLSSWPSCSGLRCSCCGALGLEKRASSSRPSDVSKRFEFGPRRDCYPHCISVGVPPRKPAFSKLRLLPWRATMGIIRPEIKRYRKYLPKAEQDLQRARDRVDAKARRQDLSLGEE